jgi:GNAT superfamily N-acetyltransferase
MRRSPGFTLVAMLLLALGLGATSAIYSVVSALLLRPLPFAGGDRVVAVAGYERLREPDVAEVAFAVADELQGHGLGTRMLEQLADYAAQQGMRRFIADVLADNKQMLGVFEAAGFAVTGFRVPHYTLETYALRVEGDGRALAYSGDSAPSDDLVEAARDADLFVCEATLSDSAEDGLRGHLSAPEAVAAFEAAGARRLLVVHRPDELELEDGLERAYDGLELSV